MLQPVLCAIAIACGCAASIGVLDAQRATANQPQVLDASYTVLPPAAAVQLSRSLAAARPHARHVWRDTPPTTDAGLVNAYIEIPKGERRKFEFDMSANQRAVDRVMPESVGGYPVNYGFVPQTVSYDGDPFDVLVLGPPLAGGTIVPGAIVGLMFMEDEKGSDAKTVLSPLDGGGRPLYSLSEVERERIGEYFRNYKRHETGKFSRVPGWGSRDDGKRLIEITHLFFQKCRRVAGESCRVTDGRAVYRRSHSNRRVTTT